MGVRAKFKVTNIEPQNHEGMTIHLHPIYSADPESENAKFYKYTPSGSIVLSTINRAAAEQFTPGAEFYVDFTLASEEAKEVKTESAANNETTDNANGAASENTTDANKVETEENVA